MARDAAFFQLYDEDTAGRRPASLAEPRGPQVRVQRRVVQQIADFAPMVQILDVPVPPVVLGGVQDQILLRVVAYADADDMEQVIEVLKIFCPYQPPPCARLPAPVAVKQLVDVLVLSFHECSVVPVEQTRVLRSRGSASFGGRSQVQWGPLVGVAHFTPSGTRQGTLTVPQLQFIDGVLDSRQENSGGASDSASDSGGEA